MIVLFTDFGVNGPYVGQMKAVLHGAAPGVPIVDLLHDAPAFEPRLSAYLLAAYAQEFPEGSVFVCVVDPGVGSARRPVILRAGNRTFVGLQCQSRLGRGELHRWISMSHPGQP